MMDNPFDDALPLEQRFFGAGIRPAGRLNAASALAVYQRAYVARLFESLGENYEAVRSVLGDERFFALCTDYIKATPSTVYNVSAYGECFPEFIDNHEVSRAFIFLADLARFERALVKLFHQKQHAAVPIEDLARMGECAQAKLVFGQALVFFESPFRVYEIWRNRSQVDWEGNQRLLLYKTQGRVCAQCFDEAEFRVLKLLSEGLKISELEQVCEGNLEAHQITDLFYFIASAGIVSQIDSESEGLIVS